MTRVFSMVLAIFFGMGGLAKLLGVRVMHYPFVELGLSSWYGYLIAIMEVSFAVGVLVKSFASMSALGMTVVILGITYYHWSYFPLNAVIPDIVLLLLLSSLAMYAMMIVLLWIKSALLILLKH